jgi:ElaB/YqjD/DUF883 family membrane-anchored ribosome-binding protein
MSGKKIENAIPTAMRQPLTEAVIVRARSEDLEAVLKNMPRTSDATKVRLREYFVDGLSMHEIADRHRCAVSQVHNAVRHTRVALAAQMSPWNYVGVTITVPILLAQELQAMSDQLAELKDRNRADECLGSLIYAIADVQKKITRLDKR